MKLYPIADNLTPGEKKRYGVKSAAVYAGEKRCPSKGEWYLSGAIVGAYRARNDLTTPYHIAKLLKVETITTYLAGE